ncbi:MAG: UDP-N-acetylglucosamine--N-acetylmuramyl-(pentapeptide) pyrophosphoryl-undecaprenol N-acetylglucosamine transferase [Clostridia bacterium]|nr:UDP-N-acetylglucosamine--N-acetylmuramyl-(pentapeptide) pyrophosphoryl-undecaprenol N-acetylglucosamine transferase [Clostridia bacterium]
MRVLLTGGGTAGHINPALAIAETIKQNDPDAVIEFVGIRTGKETDLVPRAGYRLHFVEAQGIRRSLSPSNIKALWLALTSPYSKKTVSIIKDFKPDVVIGTGGFTSWPLMAAAARMGIPTALHESNSLPGLAVRRLQKKVDRIWINFPSTREKLRAKDRVLHVGNPLRGGFGTLSRTEAKRKLGIAEDRMLILSFGGSLGAEAVNRAAIDLMADTVRHDATLCHVHATGKGEYERWRSYFAERGLESAENCVLTDYIYDMPTYMAAADLVISRAGAMTLSELAHMKKACILIPSPHVTDNHQYKNAKEFADVAAASLIVESELNGETLSKEVRRLTAPRARIQYQTNITAFAGKDANRLIWEDVQALVKGRSQK